MKYDLPALHEQLVEAYNEDELQHLCFVLDVEYEDIEGPNRTAKARELLTYLDRRDRIPELIQESQKQRPAKEWNLIVSQQTQNEEFRQQLGLNTVVRRKYLDQKFEIYRSVWQSLYAVKEAGDELWNRASKENIANFAALLQQARWLVGINAILFDQEDYAALVEILDRFGRFEAGKYRLFRIRSENERTIDPQEVSAQIRANGELKAEYEDLLDRVLSSFRTGVALLTTSGKDNEVRLRDRRDENV